MIFERRYNNGLTLNGSYVFSRNLTSLTDIAEAVGTVVNNRGYDWGNSNIGFANKFTARVSYELPFGKHAKGFQKAALGGWQVNAIAFWQSGEPYTVTDGQNLINLPNITSDRPNVVPGQSCQAANPSISDWINLNAFQQQAIGNPGSEQRAGCFGPAWRSIDFSMFKNFQITEKYKLEFRAEAYNITNTPNFSLPNAAISSWTVKDNPAGIATNAGAFGQITATNVGFTPRVIQLAMKLNF